MLNFKYLYIILFFTLFSCKDTTHKNVIKDHWPNGNLKTLIEFDHDNKDFSTVSFYRMNGSISKSFQRYKNMTHGLYQEYTSNGDLYKKLKYKFDIPVDSAFIYDTASSQLSLKRVFINDTLGLNKNLKQIFYNQNGKIDIQRLSPLINTYIPKNKLATVDKPFSIHFSFIDHIPDTGKVYLIKLTPSNEYQNSFFSDTITSTDFTGRHGELMIPKIDSTYKYFSLKFKLPSNFGQLNNTTFFDSLIFFKPE
ncbi:hypothetical protein [Aureibacter tunicatorum]|uniref:Uncharacterized protein n=1 Tax=Aureibacter tunicatorum TaxID=866807 RepID=A0AAE3XRY2_9BACT|nr:hypothetical protein [Aureibacter tunicatorum]MDR6240983.1 hypothetical protein [Aureibacter tunicatorum]BDD03762.1 hypothetical protein AUTU_12450 [Aureibacter tunicatorum]